MSGAQGEPLEGTIGAVPVGGGMGAVVLTVALQVLAVVAPGLGRILGTAPLSARGWLIAVALAAIPALVGQGWKRLRQWRESARALSRGAR